MIISLEEVVELLNGGDVRYLIIGGWAAIIHGTARATYDVDVLYARDAVNIEKLAATMAAWSPYLRGAPPGLPFRFDPPTIRAGLNFTLTTSHGDIDFLGEVAGGGTYEQLLPFTQVAVSGGRPCRVVNLEMLIQLKRAAGRPKDMEVIAELQALLEERTKMEPR